MNALYSFDLILVPGTSLRNRILKNIIMPDIFLFNESKKIIIEDELLVAKHPQRYSDL